jgi:hypothetical protein
LKHILYIAALFVLATFSSCKEEETEPAKLEFLATETNKMLPKRMDELTMLDSVSAKEMQFSYYYTLTEHEKYNLDFDINNVKKALINKTQSGIDTIKSFQSFKHQIRFKYIYNDKNGAYLFDYTVKTKTKHK